MIIAMEEHYNNYNRGVVASRLLRVGSMTSSLTAIIIIIITHLYKLVRDCCWLAPRDQHARYLQIAFIILIHALGQALI